MQVVFIHPDLGIGGGERLVVDAALALKKKGHRVSFITAHHDHNHCFEETKDGSFSVTTVGDWIPVNVFGSFHAVLAYAKMVYLAIYLILLSRLKPDVIFCDQVSICVPFLRLGTSAKIVFYCHFPDKLLTKRETFLKWLYRKPLDWLEEKTTGMAHLLLVNSHFTAKTFRTAFLSLKKMETHVLHPSLNTANFDRALQHPAKLLEPKIPPSSRRFMFLSINRFERKKNLALAIRALDNLRGEVTHENWKSIHLVIAGGYDERVKENVDYYKELQKLVESMQLRDKVTFCRSIQSSQKMALLKSSTAVLYTPDNEHFGIVPVEAMYMQTPVIAVNTGGPRETVVHNETGFLCDGDAEHFSSAMLRLIQKPMLSKEMGAKGRERVLKNFSFDNFANTLNGIIQSILT
ncbi:unnamed protein product [Clavelina lepadiformis]|uniref:Alpha-1,3/1,6-mannosyltransferase ALG2 n=1 Tax=Clavelina lepadiformis TaxID=159417 RepID=A0ABP0GHK0_CLALP